MLSLRLSWARVRACPPRPGEGPMGKGVKEEAEVSSCPGSTQGVRAV